MILMDYIDKFGMYSQSPPQRDGGDSAQREGMVMAGAEWGGVSSSIVRTAYIHATLPQLMAYGNGRRHPDPTKWYSDWDRFSRDQAISLLIGMFMAGAYLQAFKFFLRHCTRGLLFMTNTRRNFMYPTLEEHLQKATPDVVWDYSWKLPDLTGPEFWSIYVRGFRYPISLFIGLWSLVIGSFNPILISAGILTVLDLELLIGVLVKVLWYARTPTNDDDNNLIMSLMFSKKLTTPVSFLARKIYRLRPLAAPPKIGYQSTFGPQTALDSYFRAEKGDPPINEIYRKFLEGEL